MFTINIHSNIKEFQRTISAAAFKQMPFATAQALTALAQDAAEAERVNETKVLDRPKPFTQNAIAVVRARKDRMTAKVFMKDITARYLEPYQFGGKNVLNGRALLKPIEAVKDLDQFGNVPRRFIKQMQGRADVFIGSVRTKNGVVNGVWQRTVDAAAKSVAVARISKNGKLRMGRTRKALNTSGRLKLLIKFDDAHPVRQYLDWFGVAQRVVNKNFNRRMGSALAKAIATAR